MKTIEYRTVNKSKWGPGAWQDEPDKVQWQDAATGLPCLIVRNPFGALCGYVGLAKGHPLHGKHYDECGDLDVHGGLTFANFCADTEDKARHICHAPDPGEPDDVWWLGFDCGHFRDISPVMRARELEMGWEHLFRDEFVSYKDINYVRAEVAKLAAQLRNMA